MNTAIHKIVRVNNGVNFWNSSKHHIWGTNGTAGTNNVNTDTILWFVTNDGNGHIIAVATFVSINPRNANTMSNEQLGWSTDEGNGNWNYEIHYKDLYDITHLDLYSNIKGQCRIREYSEKCAVNLPKIYPNIVKYSNAVYFPCGKMAAWRVVGGALNNLKTLQVYVEPSEVEVAMPRVEVIDSPVKELLATLIPKVEIINLPAKELMAKADPNNKSENLSIKDALEHLFKQYNIETKTELDLWCGKSRKKLYNYVKNMAPEHWNLIKTPESSVRAAYEVRLSGYKISKDNKSM